MVPVARTAAMVQVLVIATVMVAVATVGVMRTVEPVMLVETGPVVLLLVSAAAAAAARRAKEKSYIMICVLF